MVAPRAQSRTPIAPSSQVKARYIVIMFTVAAFAVLLDQAWRIAEHMTATATSAAAGTAGTGNSGEFEHHQLGLSTTPTIEKTYVRSVGEDRSLSANPSGNDGGLHIENVDTHSHSASKTVSVGYMARHARTLREESDRLEKSLEEDWRQAAKSRSASTGKPATTTRISHPLHLVLYASPPTTHNNNTNVMAELLRLQAERSAFFVSVTVLGPNDIPDEFHREFKDMLPSPQVHQQTVDFGLWRYPLWENVMHHIPLYDTILFLDSSSTAGVYAGGVSMLDKWVKRVVESSERKNEPRRELMRFPQDPRKNGDLKWTNDAVFDAFGLEIQGDNSWWQATKVQYYGGVMIVRNGAQWRNMTSLIYRTLAKDPYIITDRYSEVTRKRRPTRFGGHKYDQSITSIASKVLDNHIQSPLMANWANPPFRLCQHQVRKYAISELQVQQWSSECKTVGRDKDHYCDSFFDGGTPQ